MPQVPDFRELVSRLHSAHITFISEFNRHGIGYKKQEAPSVTQARDKFWDALNNVFAELAKYDAGFETSDSSCLDAIIAFLEVDVPAFRCGYAKEKYFHKLKNLKLNSSQIERLKNIAYALCASNSYRREYRDAVRLMIKLADSDFMKRVKSLESDANKLVRFKAKLMLETIMQNRADLRN